MNSIRQFIIFLFPIIFLSACYTPLGKEKPQTVKAPKYELNVGFIMLNGVYNSELMAPYDIFHHTKFHADPAMKVFTVSPTLESITTFEGLKITPDYSFENSPAIDVLVVPSAEHSMDSDLENDTLIRFVRELGQTSKYLVSLCDGAFILAKAGLLDSLHATTFPGDVAIFREMFPAIKTEEGVSFVHHGKAITSAGGAKSFDPAMYLVHLLYGDSAAIGVGKGMVIDWNLKNMSYRKF